MNTKKITPEFRAAKGSPSSNTKKMKVFYSEIHRGLKPNPFCLSLLNASMPDWLFKGLRIDMVNSLRGFNEDLALEIADDLIDCWSGLGLHLTGIGHVDAMLWNFYFRIIYCAHRKGVTLPYRK